MEEIILTYEDHVGMFLLDLPLSGSFVQSKTARIYVDKKEVFAFGKWRAIGEDCSFEISAHVKKEKIDKFISTIKTYIDRNFGHQDGWEIIFNTDYSKLRKQSKQLMI